MPTSYTILHAALHLTRRYPRLGDPPMPLPLPLPLPLPRPRPWSLLELGSPVVRVVGLVRRF